MTNARTLFDDYCSDWPECISFCLVIYSAQPYATRCVFVFGISQPGSGCLRARFFLCNDDYTTTNYNSFLSLSLMKVIIYYITAFWLGLGARMFLAKARGRKFRLRWKIWRLQALPQSKSQTLMLMDDFQLARLKEPPGRVCLARFATRHCPRNFEKTWSGRDEMLVQLVVCLHSQIRFVHVGFARRHHAQPCLVSLRKKGCSSKVVIWQLGG